MLLASNMLKVIQNFFIVIIFSEYQERYRKVLFFDLPTPALPKNRRE